MIVTNGIKVFDTDYMIKIDQRENTSSWSLLEKILFSEEENEYYYFCKTNYNAPNNIKFRSTYADSLIELDEAKKDEFFINDYLADFEWCEAITYVELASNLTRQLEYEYDGKQYDFSEIDSIAQRYDNEKNVDDESFLNNINEILKQNQIEPLIQIENLDDVVESIDALKCDLLFDVNEFKKKIRFEIRVAAKGFYLIYQAEYEPLTYAFVTELPVAFILKYCYFNQRFEDLVYILKYIPQDYRDESVEDRKYNYLFDSEMAMIWGVTRQNFSKTYSNPIESQKRLRKRQKMIIELGCTALKYGLSEKEILDLAKSLKK
ncbi:hypothetical protein [Sulfuricurvum sp.]|uniref:hypothetical protein n=1 Tax=Sulfuricurvum sp. TaxID=2025608 RepID=UPI00261B63F1|nr:hypothetical protein [Sulfuricurvum sp.]MDD3598127.1 hypothetical protein [Sulfuricurvum sp.]